MREFIIIHHEPLTRKIKRNFFIDELINKGVKVQYWSVDKLIFGKPIKLIDELSENYVTVFSSFSQLEYQIRLNRDAIFLLEFQTTIRSVEIMKLLSGYRCIVSRIAIHSTINLSTKEKIQNVRNYGFNKLKIYFENIFPNIVSKILFRIYRLNNVDIFYYCGEASLNQWNAKKKIPVNSFDYEDYLTRTEKVSRTEKKYAIFLDEYLPYHPDIQIWGKQKLTPEKYYNALNDFFDKLESKYGIEVIIAAHPKSDYEQSKFSYRKIVKYKTPELVKYCEFVIAHDSMSISFPVLNYKPIYFVYTEEFYNMGTSTLTYVKKNARLLGQPLINLDKKYIIESYRYDKIKYDKYKYLYLTSKDAEKKMTSDIIYTSIIDYDMLIK